MTPEQKARIVIDEKLAQAGWTIQDYRALNLGAGRGIAVREHPTSAGPADYLLYVDRVPVGVIEAKRDEAGENLTVTEAQTAGYAGAKLKWRMDQQPLPLMFEATGQITRFTDNRDPAPRSREVFSFFRPETLAAWLTQPSSLRRRLHEAMPPLPTENLRDCQTAAVTGLEQSLAENRPRALVHMANPPFGKKSSMTITNEEGEEDRDALLYERQDFWETTSNKQLNFLQHIVSMLKVNGRAAVVLPDNVLFEGGAGEKIRRKLLETCDVHTVLRLPTGIFYAQGVKANVVFFDNAPKDGRVHTKGVWFYDLRTNQHFTLKTRPLRLPDLQDFIRCYNPANRHERVATERFKYYACDELVARDKASLDVFWLKDASLDNLDDLPPPDVLQQEIIEHLEAALAAFRDVAASLPSSAAKV
jgi:hypothetical protein